MIARARDEAVAYFSGSPARTRAFGVSAIFLYALILRFVGFDSWRAVTVCLLFVNFFRNTTAASLASAGYLIFAGVTFNVFSEVNSYVGDDIYRVIGLQFLHDPLFFSYQVKALGFIGVLSFLFLFHRASSRMRFGRFDYSIPLFFVCVLTGLAGVDAALKLKTAYAAFYCGCLIFLLRVSFPYVYLIQQSRYDSDLRKPSNFILFLPTLGSGGFARERVNLNAYLPKGADGRIQCQLNGLRLGMLALLLYVLAQVAAHFFWGVGGDWEFMAKWPSMHLTAPGDYRLGNSAHLNAFHAWFTLLGSLFWFLVEYAGFRTAVVIATVRLCGYNLRYGIDRPWLASSFMDFINRLMYYYVYAISMIFFIPTYRLLAGLREKQKLRIFISLLSGVFVGGFVTHVISEVHYIFQHGLFPAVRSVAPNFFLYYSAMTFCMSLSLIDFKTGIERKIPGFGLARVSFYFALYALLLFSLMNCRHQGWRDKVDFCRLLFLVHSG